MKTKNAISIFISMLIIFGIFSSVNAGAGPSNQTQKRVAQPVAEQVIPGSNDNNYI